MTLAQVVGQVVLRVLRPGDPRLVDLEVSKYGLVDFQMPLRWSWCSWVRIARSRCPPHESWRCFDHVADRLAVVEERLRARLVAAVDHHVVRLAAALAREGDQEAVAVALAVHAHRDAVLGRPQTLDRRHQRCSSS